MPKEKKTPAKPPRPYGQGKRPKTMRFTPETIRKLQKASSDLGVSETVYVEMSLRKQFRKDGIE